jgi:plasmid stabilization system protein ParE
MNLPVVINPLAEEDIAEAKAWYNRQRDGLGDEFLEGVDEALNQIGQWPKLSRKVHQELRRKLVRRFPYGIFFRIDDTQITVVAVYHCKRDPRGWEIRA